MSRSAFRYPSLHLQFLVVILSLTAILGKEINLTAVPLVFWRCSIAVVGLLALYIISPKKSPLLPKRLRLSCLTGIVLGLHWITFFLAIKLSNVSVCLAGMTISAAFTSITEAVIEKRLPKRTELALGIAIIPGLLLMIYGLNSSDLMNIDGYLTGFLVALSSAFLASIFPVLNRQLVSSGESPRAITLIELATAGLLCATVSLVLHGHIHMPAQRDWLWLFILAIACTVFAFCYHCFLLKHISAFTSNLAINFEPVYGILLAALIYKEHQAMSYWVFIGITIILLINLLHMQLLRCYKKRIANSASSV